MRKKLAVAAVLALAVSLAAVYGTMAYLSAQGTAHNIITAGGIQIELLDKTQPEDVEVPELADLPDFDQVYPDGMPVMPGTDASKIVTVRKLEDSAPCWVRIKLEASVTDREGEPMDHGGSVAPRLNTGSGETEWTPGGDGWYYYNSPLTGEAPQAEPLLSGVKFDGPGMGNAFQSARFVIAVTAQAVQSDNNGVPEGGSVLDVKGWSSDEPPVTPPPETAAPVVTATPDAGGGTE